ncbi:unnamed protein product [Sphagnum troendelagicum]
MCACVRRVQSIETNLIRVERCAPDLHSLTVASQRWCVETARDTSKFGQVLSRSKQQKIALSSLLSPGRRTRMRCEDNPAFKRQMPTMSTIHEAPHQGPAAVESNGVESLAADILDVVLAEARRQAGRPTGRSIDEL